MFQQGDVVRIRKGKVEYGVAYDLGNEAKIVSHNTGKATLVDPARLVLVKSYEDQAAESLENLQTIPDVRVAEKEALAGTVASEVPEHTPGESPAAYKRRTGLKLDGRTTSYGRAILGALQASRFAPTPKKIKAARRRARNLFRVVKDV